MIDDKICVDPDNDAKSHDTELTEERKVANYLEILHDARKLVNPGGQLLVTPGNHDNRLALGKAAVEAGIKGAYEDMFMIPGAFVQYVKIHDWTIVVMDTGDDIPYQGIAKLAYTVNRTEKWDRRMTMVFTHKPFKATNLYHRFMDDKMLDRDLGLHVSQYAAEYFCGHLHHYASINDNINDMGICMTVCPGIQCQIDPYSEKCNAVPLPGYMQITFDTYYYTVEKKVHFLDKVNYPRPKGR